MPKKEDNPSDLVADEVVAIGAYTIWLSIPLNSVLWSARGVPETVKPFVNEMNSGLAKLPKYFGPVVRWLYLTDEEITSEFRNHLTTHKPTIFYAFTSCSKNLRYVYDPPRTGLPEDWVDKKFVKLIIISKTGRDITKYSGNPEEEEVLFRNETPFNVDRVNDKKDPVEIHLTEL